MAVPQFTDYIPFQLNSLNSFGIPVAVSSASPTLAAEAVTGLKLPTGAEQGARFYLSNSQAAALSASTFPCRAGWYRVVLIDSGATAANILYGAVGAMVSVAKGQNVVTDAGSVLSLGAAPVLFLGTATVGQYTIVQDLNEGEGNFSIDVSQTISVGSVLVSSSTGLVSLSGAISLATYITTIGMAEAAFTSPAQLTLTAAAAPAAGATVAVYTGTITSGGSNAYKGAQVVIAGFTTAANNGTFYCTASTTTTLTLQNSAAAAETHAGTANVVMPVRGRCGAPFAI
jgi:hypothetical protein